MRLDQTLKTTLLRSLFKEINPYPQYGDMNFFLKQIAIEYGHARTVFALS